MSDNSLVLNFGLSFRLHIWCKSFNVAHPEKRMRNMLEETNKNADTFNFNLCCMIMFNFFSFEKPWQPPYGKNFSN